MQSEIRSLIYNVSPSWNKDSIMASFKERQSQWESEAVIPEVEVRSIEPFICADDDRCADTALLLTALTATAHHDSQHLVFLLTTFRTMTASIAWSPEVILVFVILCSVLSQDVDRLDCTTPATAFIYCGNVFICLVLATEVQCGRLLFCINITSDVQCGRLLFCINV